MASLSQCPDCGATFRAGEPACPECGVELYDDPEAEHGERGAPASHSTTATSSLAPGSDAPAPIWDLDSTTPVPMGRWGKDHWTTFAYVETRWVDHRGMLDHDRMRCDRRRHPVFYAAKRRTTAFGSDADGARYPTRLKTETACADGRWGVVELAGHDDYDCLDDAIREGLIEVAMPRIRQPHGDIFLDAWDRPVRIPDDDVLIGDARPPKVPRGTLIGPALVTGSTEMWLMTAASFSLTEQGRTIAGELRAHLAATRNSHQFVPACAFASAPDCP